MLFSPSTTQTLSALGLQHGSHLSARSVDLHVERFVDRRARLLDGLELARLEHLRRDVADCGRPRPVREE